MCGESAKSARYRAIAAQVRKALPQLMTPAGYFVMAQDPDGTRRGVFGAAKHGYFEATPNHDAGCFEVADDDANRKIVRYMLALKGPSAPGDLMPHDLIIPNYPSYDDTVYGGAYGSWVNGGHWTTTQARMSIACLRANEFAHPFSAWAKIRDLVAGYRADAPLPNWGGALWDGSPPYNIVYDCWGAPAGLLRGLFEYDYRADRLLVRPHLPAAITRYVQKFPIWFGRTRIYLSVTGSGATGWQELRPTGEPGVLAVEIVRGGAARQGAWTPPASSPTVTFEPIVYPWPPPTSGNENPLRIGASPSGGYEFQGDFRDVRIYRRALTAAEIGILVKGKAVPGALLTNPPANHAPAHLIARREDKFWEFPPSADIDFQVDFTLAASVLPKTLADNARLIDRATAGTMDGYLLDYLQGGKVLRLITPWGVARGPAALATGKWQHVAATCSADGLMRVYFNGALVAESQGRRPTPSAEVNVERLDFRKLAAFHESLVKAGLQESYEAAEARTALELLAAYRQRFLKPLHPPHLVGIPDCNSTAVDTLYLHTACWIAGGLLDRLVGRSLWKPDVTSKVRQLAKRSGIVP
jgi:hypothetical protein